MKSNVNNFYARKDKKSIVKSKLIEISAIVSAKPHTWHESLGELFALTTFDNINIIILTSHFYNRNKPKKKKKRKEPGWTVTTEHAFTTKEQQWKI